MVHDGQHQWVAFVRQEGNDLWIYILPHVPALESLLYSVPMRWICTFMLECWQSCHTGKSRQSCILCLRSICSVLYCGGWPRQGAPFQATLSLWEAESLSSGSFSSPRPQVLPAGTSPRCLWLCLVTLPIETAPSLGPHPVVVLVSCFLWVTSPFLVTFQQLSCS